MYECKKEGKTGVLEAVIKNYKEKFRSIKKLCFLLVKMDLVSGRKQSVHGSSANK